MGEDANLAIKLGAACFRGFYGREFGAHCVTTDLKHFPSGDGPIKDGKDGHFRSGKNQSVLLSVSILAGKTLAKRRTTSATISTITSFPFKRLSMRALDKS